jgi:peptide/nickel transport system ATP-binding protein
MNHILEIKNLTVAYETSEGIVEAVNNFSLSVEKGLTVGIVGETGAGKTTLAKTIMRLIPNPPGVVKSGQIFYEGEDLLILPESKMGEVRGKQISMIFQDPMTSLNPVITVEKQIAEVIEKHENLSVDDSISEARKMLKTVGIPPNRGAEYPHQFSGGMKQRVVIAIAMACNPSLLLADEPTTALDVTIQAQVLDMIRSLHAKYGTSVVLITHDLGVVAQNCDRVAIMYAGETVDDDVST